MTADVVLGPEPAADADAPMMVAVLDVEHLPGAVVSDRHASLRALVRRDGRPLGYAQLEFRDGVIAAEQLERVCATVVTAAAPQPSGPSIAPEVLPSISVVIPSLLERQDLLKQTLTSLRALHYPDFEVVLVDSRMEGDLPEWLGDFPEVRTVRAAHRGLSAARNAGIDAACCEILAFTDDDVTVDAGWLTAYGEWFVRHPDDVAVAGLAMPAELETPAQLQLEAYYGGFGPRLYEPLRHALAQPRGRGTLLRRAQVVGSDAAGHVVRTFSLYAMGALGAGANMAFRTAILRRYGGFDLTLGPGMPTCGGEETYLLADLVWKGHSVGFEPAALVHHTHRRDPESLRRQVEGYGVGFGATMLAFVVNDARHVGAMLATVPRAVRAMGATYAAKLRGTGATASAAGPTFDGPSLARLELAGIVRGPAAYVRSRRMVRSWRG
jgi:hypothetical protein